MQRNCSLCSVKFLSLEQPLVFSRGQFVFCPDCWRDLAGVVNVPDEQIRKREEFVAALIGYTHVVINRCHGGFSLSHQAKVSYLERCGIKFTTGESRDRDWHSRWGPDIFVKGQRWDEHSVDRADPYLVAVVRELGADASGPLAKLKIVSVPQDVEWVISEFDGIEWVAERHRVWV